MRRYALILLAAAIGGCHRQEAAAPQATPETPATSAQQETPAVETASVGKPAPDREVQDASGQPVKLTSLKGKPLLVNLWATWCAPCVKELPTLDALAKREGDRLQVMAVSEDLEGGRVVQPFLAKRGFTTLKPYLDNDNGLMLALKEAGLPVTILYGADGKELWRVRGGMDWTGAKARQLLGQAGV